MSSSLINSGIQFLNDPPKDKQKTIIVIGSPRSGTSMIGKVLYSLGVFKGDIDKTVYADKAAIDVLEKNVTEQSVNKYFSKQNELYDVWGFKRPGAFFYIRKLEHLIRNPIYVVPFKDILSISMRKNISIGQDFKTSLKETIELHDKLVNFVLTSKTPMLLFSYEKAMLDPEKFVYSIVKLLKLNCTESQISKAIESLERNPTNYLNSSRELVYGNVDPINDLYLSGWAKARNHENQVEISIFINEKLSKTVLANNYRADLKNNNMGNGKYAFKVKISDLEINKGDKVQVFAGIHNDELNNSPLII